MIQANTVITGDSLTVLRDMEADSVDMVITDPPYGIDYQSGRNAGGGYSVLPAGTFSRYSSTRCVSLA